MKRTIILLAASILLSGCGIFKNVFKHRTSEKSLTESVSNVKTDSKVNIIDNSKITITETIDTFVTIGEVRGSVKNKINLQEVKNGLTLIDDEFVILKQVYDSNDSTLKTEYTLKPRTAPVQKKKVTEIFKDVKSEEVKKAEKSQSNKNTLKKSEAIVERKANYSIIFAFIIFVGLVLLVKWAVSKSKFLK